MKNLRVKNLMNNGRNVPNQFLITYEENGKEYTIFQSYNSMILKWENNTLIEVGSDWDYSRTTRKYMNTLIVTNSKKLFEKYLNDNFEWNEDTQTYRRK